MDATTSSQGPVAAASFRKLVAAALARPSHYKHVSGNLRVKEVHVLPGGDGDGGARPVRFVICDNPGHAERDAEVRVNPTSHLESLIAEPDQWTPWA